MRSAPYIAVPRVLLVQSCLGICALFRENGVIFDTVLSNVKVLEHCHKIKQKENVKIKSHFFNLT